MSTEIEKPKVKSSKFKNSVPKQRATVRDMTSIFANEKVVDGFDNFISKLGLNNENPLSAGTYEFNLITRNRVLLEAAYRGSWIVGQVVKSVAADMTRAGISVVTNKGKDNLQELKNAQSRLRIWKSFNTLIKWGRLYGGAIAVVQVKGQKLDTPINLDTIGKDQFQGLVVYDRWQLNPAVVDLIDSGPEMGLPVYYDIVNDPRSTSGGNAGAPPNNNPNLYSGVGQIRVHHSRVIRNIGIELPYFQAITEMMWGESVLEQLWDRLISFDDATLASANLISRASLRTVGVEGLRQIIAAGGAAQEGLVAMFEMMRSMQTNEGLTLLDKEDTFQTTSYSFAGLSDMVLQFAQQVSGAAEIPLIRLLGQSPPGLNSNGAEDIRMYYDSINAKQEEDLRPGVEMVLQLLWRSTFGKPCPDDLQFTFAPLWQMTAIDKVNNAKASAETIIGAFEANLTGKAVALKELRQTSSDTGIFSNITDEDIDEAEEDDANPPMPETQSGAPGSTEDPANPEAGKIKKPVPSLDSKWNPKNWFKGNKNGQA